MGILENGHHVALGLAVVVATTPIPGPAGALGAVPTPGPVGAPEVVPVHLAESPMGAAAMAASAVAAEGAAAVVVTLCGRDGRWILRS